MTELTTSRRIRVRRQPARGRYDRASVEAVLDRALFGHVAFVHGSSASRALRTLASGVPACVTVTRLDGLVLARSVFEHSANYESAVVLGRFERIENDAERLAAFEAFTEKLVPGRWAEVRPPNRKELKATAILAMPIEEASVKARSGPPTDDDTPDAAADVWAGEVPVVTTFGAPVASPGLREGIAVSQSVRSLVGNGQ
jgi:uncharacterized protein